MARGSIELAQKGQTGTESVVPRVVHNTSTHSNAGPGGGSTVSRWQTVFEPTRSSARSASPRLLCDGDDVPSQKQLVSGLHLA